MTKDKTLNIFFALPTGVLGGAERIVFNLAMMLLKNGHYVTIYIMSRGEQAGWEHLKSYPRLTLIVKNYGSEKTSLPAFLFNLFYLSYNHNYDYALSSHSHINGVLSFMRKIKLFKTSFLISRESTFVFERYFGFWRYIFKFIYKYMYGAQDLLICQTENMKLSLIENLGYKPAKKVEVIPNFVNIDFILKQINSSKLNDKPFPFLIVACGRLIPLKKFDNLIEAFSDIHHNFPQVGLVIIGDGPEREKLEKMVSSKKITYKVIFTGKISNPIQWFNKANLGVISSEIEGFPNVLIEMMASGTSHIITTPCTDGVKDIPNITITESCTVDSLKSSLVSLLTNPIDNSLSNIKYINDYRSVDSFWKKIKAFTNENTN